MLTAIIVLAIMILPTVITVSASAIRAVSDDLRAASLSLGASKMQTIFKVVIPAARSGILTGIVLGIGRALGEAMAINMVAGGVVNLPLPFNSVRFLTTQLVSEMGYAGGLHREALFTVGLVLYIFIMVINLVLLRIRTKERKKTVRRKEPMHMITQFKCPCPQKGGRWIQHFIFWFICVPYFPFCCLPESSFTYLSRSRKH